MRLFLSASTLLIFSSTIPTTTAWQPSSPTTRRRHFWQQAVGLWIATTTPTHAACMLGDVNPECIGVYKIPLSDTMPSPQQLAQFAPDVTYQPPPTAPPTSAQALQVLQKQRQLAVTATKEAVSSGQLETAGVQVLQLLGQLTVAGRCILQQIRATEPSSTAAQYRTEKLSEQWDYVLAAWQGVDVTIGQGMRGALGATAVAQLRVLSEIQEATALLDDFLKVVEKLV